eukprot:CAMPEP_0179462660 /NCGR_PEP_ID=MMETSP0799-20121207/44951_1 /TAXON_ID=46947 /ORGANISM="Geminigera cryophila, Strain CCMP2564" /LENGTH=126 /DNA_ID=CAMNT_0021265615 /DNA_START=313 /DNA_END=690 /DNA_ORIENTATION=-
MLRNSLSPVSKVPAAVCRPPRYWPDELCRPPKHPRLQAAVCHPPRHWPDEPRRPPKYSQPAVLPKRRSLKNRPKSTPAHGSVAAAVSHKHHSIIRVGAGLLPFVHALYLHLGREAICIKNLFRPFP